MKRIAASGRTLILPAICFLLILDFTSNCAYSQNSQGTILGHVQDPSGAAVAGAKVTSTNLNTSVTNHFVTNSAGDYVFVKVIPGTYRVSVEHDGSKTEVSGNLILEVDQTLRQDFKFQIGAAKEMIAVVAEARLSRHKAPMATSQRASCADRITKISTWASPKSFPSLTPAYSGAVRNVQCRFNLASRRLFPVRQCPELRQHTVSITRSGPEPWLRLALSMGA